MEYSTGPIPYSLAAGDFNNDSRLDIVVANSGSDYIEIIFGYPNEIFMYQMTLTTVNASSPRSFVVADFNNDDKIDIGIVYSDTHNIALFLGYGNISFTSPKTFSTGPHSSPYSIAAADFNNDTQLDIIVANSDSNNVGIFLGYGNGSFGNQTTFPTGSSPLSVAVSDFNNDTIPDIVVANYGTNNLGVLLRYGNGAFANVVLIAAEYGSHPFSVLVGDFNNDRKLDFAAANNGTDSLSIFLQTC
jgi:hypothetical protein